MIFEKPKVEHPPRTPPSGPPPGALGEPSGKGLPCDYDNDATTTTILLYLTYTVTTINYDNDWTLD